jgi:hypothetical protein
VARENHFEVPHRNLSLDETGCGDEGFNPTATIHHNGALRLSNLREDWRLTVVSLPGAISTVQSGTCHERGWHHTRRRWMYRTATRKPAHDRFLSRRRTSEAVDTDKSSPLTQRIFLRIRLCVELPEVEQAHSTEGPDVGIVLRAQSCTPAIGGWNIWLRRDLTGTQNPLEAFLRCRVPNSTAQLTQY